MKKLWFLSIPVAIALILVFGLPAFAQTHLAAAIPGQPLSGMAATMIIKHSGLPAETLPGDIATQLTRGRDVINAYRYAHEQLYIKGWYRGISDDHTPLIQAMTEALKGEGYKGESDSAVLGSFFYQSDTENAKELGYDSLESLNIDIARLVSTGKAAEAKLITDELNAKWR